MGPTFSRIMTEQAEMGIELMAKIAVIFVFLVLGMRIDLSHLREEKKRTVLLGVSGIIIPFTLGYQAGAWLGYSSLMSLVIGVCLAISAESTNAQVFIEMKLMKKKLTRVIFGASMMDALFALLAITFLLGFVQQDISSLAIIPVKILVFVVAIMILLRLMPILIKHIENDESKVSQVSMMILFGLLVAVLAIQLGL